MVKDSDNQQGSEDEKNENKSTGSELLDAATQTTEDDCLILLKALAVGQLEQEHNNLGFSMMIFIEAMNARAKSDDEQAQAEADLMSNPHAFDD